MDDGMTRLEQLARQNERLAAQCERYAIALGQKQGDSAVPPGVMADSAMDALMTLLVEVDMRVEQLRALGIYNVSDPLREAAQNARESVGRTWPT